MHIQITSDDKVDPYPAVIEALRETFGYAHTLSDAMSEAELSILEDMQTACYKLLEAKDPHSATNFTR